VNTNEKYQMVQMDGGNCQGLGRRPHFQLAEAKKNVARGLINAGGDLRVWGGFQPAEPWVIGIANPLNGEEDIALVSLFDHHRHQNETEKNVWRAIHFCSYPAFIAALAYSKTLHILLIEDDTKLGSLLHYKLNRESYHRLGL
jgi:hypothetical protein